MGSFTGILQESPLRQACTINGTTHTHSPLEPYKTGKTVQNGAKWGKTGEEQEKNGWEGNSGDREMVVGECGCSG